MSNIHNRIAQLEDQCTRMGFFSSEEQAENAHRELEHLRALVDRGLTQSPSAPPLAASRIHIRPGEDLEWPSTVLGRTVKFTELDDLEDQARELLRAELSGAIHRLNKAAGKLGPDQARELQGRRDAVSTMLTRLNQKSPATGPLTDGERQKLQNLISQNKALEAKARELERVAGIVRVTRDRATSIGRLLCSTEAFCGRNLPRVPDATLGHSFLAAARKELEPEVFSRLIAAAVEEVTRQETLELEEFTQALTEARSVLLALVAAAQPQGKAEQETAVG